jgi:hypothetical protein
MTEYRQLAPKIHRHVERMVDQDGVFEDLVETFTEVRELYEIDKGTGEMNPNPTKRWVNKKERRVVSKRTVPVQLIQHYMHAEREDYAKKVLKDAGYSIQIDPANKSHVKKLRDQCNELLGDETELDNSVQDIYEIRAKILGI